MLLGPGEFKNLRKKVRSELQEMGYNVIMMEDDEQTKHETRLDVKFEKILKRSDPVFIAFFLSRAKSMEGVVFEIGCICCSYGCEKIGERLMLLSSKRYNWDKRTPYINTLFSRTIRDEFDERREYFKASQRIRSFIRGYIGYRRMDIQEKLGP